MDTSYLIKKYKDKINDIGDDMLAIDEQIKIFQSGTGHEGQIQQCIHMRLVLKAVKKTVFEVLEDLENL